MAFFALLLPRWLWLLRLLLRVVLRVLMRLLLRLRLAAVVVAVAEGVMVQVRGMPHLGLLLAILALVLALMQEKETAGEAGSWCPCSWVPHPAQVVAT